MPYDILLDDSGDLRGDTLSHDFIIGESTAQHQKLLILSNKGEWRADPLAGVGLVDWTLDERPGDLNGEIKRQFERDGMTVNTVKALVAAGNLRSLTIDATYGDSNS